MQVRNMVKSLSKIHPLLYVKVYKNRIDIKEIGAKQRPLTISPTKSFTTERLLVGEFSIAEKLLKNGLKQFKKTILLAFRPIVVIQPMEMVQNEISEVEKRLLKELALGSGAYKAVVWIGHELSDDEIKEKIK
jgi:hypothetical protein